MGKKHGNIVDIMKGVNFIDPIEYIGWRNIYINNEKTPYIISANGTIFTVNYNKTGVTKALVPQTMSNGYNRILLHWKGKVYSFMIHRLVALAFIENPDPENKAYINHKDGNKQNNFVTNLEWCTAKENTQHAVQMGLIKSGAKSVQAKYDEKTIRQVCEELVKNELGPREIATKCGVSIHTVRDIRRKKVWDYVTKDYDFSKYNKKSSQGKPGEENNLATVTSDVVTQICELIVQNTMSLTDIADIFHVSYKLVQHIYGKTSWPHITSKYDFSKYTQKRTLEDKKKSLDAKNNYIRYHKI